MKVEFREIDGEEVAVPTEEFLGQIREAVYKSNLVRSGIPKDYWDLTFQDAAVGANKEVVRTCQTYYSDSEVGGRRNLYLYGLNSTAKTTTACAIAKMFIRNGKQVQFCLAEDLIDLMMKTNGFSYIPELEKIKKELFTKDLLVIDDGFDSKKSLTWESASKNIIISRWDALLRSLIYKDIRLIITSNIKKDDIKSYYGVSLAELVDRNFKVLEFTQSIKEKRKDMLGINPPE